MSRSGVSLAGFLSETEAISYFSTACVFSDRSPDACRQRWHEARARLRQVSVNPGHPDIQDIPSDYGPYLEAVGASYPRFNRVLHGARPEWKLVEVDPLLSVQIHVLTDVCNEYVMAAKRYRRTRDLQELLDICLPKELPVLPALVEKKPDGITITSKDLNLHLLGSVDGSNGNDARVAGFAWGSSINLVQVARLGDRYYLKNGYHRAVSLRRQGITHVPCLVVDVPSFAGLEVDGSGFFREEHFESDNPPTVGHLASAMAYPVELRELLRVISISVRENLVPIDI